MFVWETRDAKYNRKFCSVCRAIPFFVRKFCMCSLTIYKMCVCLWPLRCRVTTQLIYFLFGHSGFQFLWFTFQKFTFPLSFYFAFFRCCAETTKLERKKLKRIRQEDKKWVFYDFRFAIFRLCTFLVHHTGKRRISLRPSHKC